MCLGLVCILGALGVLGYTHLQEKNAHSFSGEVVMAFEQELQSLDVFETKEESLSTKVMNINGQEYLGVLLVPQLELELPVANTYSDALLQQTPCVFSGTMETDDLTIAAHNYEVHFGNIGQLKTDDEIFFVDADGVVHTYGVLLQETIDGDDLAGLYAGDWDLSLFTCSHMNNTKRTVVRLVENKTHYGSV